MTTTPERSKETAPERTDEVTVTIDGVEVSVPKDTLVIRAAEQVGVQIPRFCDHPLLAPVGACRQCLVEVPDAGNGRGMPKPQASCTMPVRDGMAVKTQLTSPVAGLYPVMVRVLPCAVTSDCGKPTATPSVTTAMPPISSPARTSCCVATASPTAAVSPRKR